MLGTKQGPGAASTLRAVTDSGVIGIVRAGSAAIARQQADRVVAAGLGVVEVSLTTPGAVDVIAALTSSASSGTVIGAGTVLTAREAQDVVAAGARIIVTPAFVPEVVDIAVRHDVAVVPGCLTPSEMTAAMARGATAVKIFPAHLWTPAALAGLLQAMPDLPCVPTGGVDPANTAAWISAGAVAVGVGSALTAVDDPGPVVEELRAAVDRAKEHAVTEGSEAARGFHHLVVHSLGQLIASGELETHTQIVPEELCEQFGVSRPVVREALRVLEAKGMVRPRPKTGTRVLPIGQWNLLDQDVIGWRVVGPQGAVQLSELSDLRAAVEVYAARKCAERATPEQLAVLRESCDAMESTGSSGDLSGFTAADVVFHTTILEASGNSVFGHFATPFAAFLHARENLHTLPDQVAGEVVEDHRRIVAAIERHDGDAAEALSRRLIENAQRELEERLAPRHGL